MSSYLPLALLYWLKIYEYHFHLKQEITSHHSLRSQQRWWWCICWVCAIFQKSHEHLRNNWHINLRVDYVIQPRSRFFFFFFFFFPLSVKCGLKDIMCCLFLPFVFVFLLWKIHVDSLYTTNFLTPPICTPINTIFTSWIENKSGKWTNLFQVAGALNLYQQYASILFTAVSSPVLKI